MDTFLLLVRLTLTGVFAISGVAKLADHAGTRRALEGFGVPPRFTSPLVLLLPIAELATAALLLPASVAGLGVACALALLGVFTIAIAVALARGRTPPCNCFGQLSARPISRRTLARNGLLLALAGSLAWAGRDTSHPDFIIWARSIESSGIMLALTALNSAVIVGLAWLALMLWRQQGRLLVRLDALEANRLAPPARARMPEGVAPAGLPLGAVAPDFELLDLAGQRVTRNALLERGNPLLLIFVDPGCGPCNVFLPTVAEWQRSVATRLSITVVSRGTAAENRAKQEAYGIQNLLFQRDAELATAYGVGIVPSAVVITPDGHIGSLIASGAEAIAALIRDALATESGGRPDRLPAAALST